MRLVCFEKEVAFFGEFHGMGVVSKSLIVVRRHYFLICIHHELYPNEVKFTFSMRPWHKSPRGPERRMVRARQNNREEYSAIVS
jgi:hypothetical protein